MSRTARLTVPGELHHVISRFVDRTWFLTTAFERSVYLQLLGRALANTDWRCFAYCLMSNHLHFAMIAGQQPLESWAKSVNGPFAQWLNKTHNRIGPVFADRPTALHVPRDRAGHVIAYIHNNPVRAGVVASAAESSWSSHRAYLGDAPRPPWLDVDAGLNCVGWPNDPSGFDAFVQGARDDDAIYIPNLSGVRAAARRKGPFEVATPSMLEPWQVPIVCRPFVARRASVIEVIAEVAVRFGMTPEAITRRYSRGPLTSAKRVAIHSGVRMGLTVSDLATALNISRQRGSKIARMSLSADEAQAVDETARALVKGCQS